MTTLLRLATVLAILALPIQGLAGTPTPTSTPPQKETKAVADKPDKVPDRQTTVSVQLEGTDSIGASLGMRIKERFNQSNLFTLNNDDERDVPRLVLLISTKPEFPSRPGAGSLYSVCWVFSQGKGYLNLLLARDMGILTSDEVQPLVDQLVERTDGLAAKYSNLMK